MGRTIIRPMVISVLFALLYAAMPAQGLGPDLPNLYGATVCTDTYIDGWKASAFQLTVWCQGIEYMNITRNTTGAKAYRVVIYEIN